MNATKGLEGAANFSTLRTEVAVCIPTRSNTSVQRILPMRLLVLE